MTKLLVLGLRAAQAFLSLMMLGLAASLIRSHHWGPFPTILAFAVFDAATTFFFALLGAVASWRAISSLLGVLGATIDICLAAINSTCGIFMAIKIGGVHCTSDYRHKDHNWNKQGANDLFNGGFSKKDDVMYHWAYSNFKDDEQGAAKFMESRCREAQADTAMMFLLTIFLCISATLLYIRRKQNN